ncbi:signal transduction histidine kinase [Clostridium acetobutylicum]|uniref:histidine kinase n=1 Tax=Clostridium acetobutylicum (strain ATCC 824 / DSM 792 / JCM 1419 / IAM 19013 / LMG 5710 / NBRC 13948 / NRRL B-527 / VKM B-1787 / 2291 / W) TaxID=272562 RepID=Q97DT1_CLOAB|nr:MULTISPECIES: histidine kinase N-terminal 7TM domain-containing protein [Clostridium]AAK81321.1 Membrane associated signal transduction histidine kinase [Clostridium acetobutylicum ATCC 824]ADZ22431.1 Membrane associated signal transduction histidine kinase [Clostridium acetobutylicum EA 2018]AEI32816.1 membrane associated signal transduction histidine kinase [Clostridium acetobutylicum DSM 1731]AWV81012.1 two-component sensor histidine kinase [Clostridium acetobutylicum]MBC2395525.1 two-co
MNLLNIYIIEISVVIISIIGFFAYYYKAANGVKSYFFLMTTGFAFSIAAILEHSNFSTSGKIVFRNVEQTILIIYPIISIAIVLDFIGKSKYIKSLPVSMALLVCSAILILIWTDDFHHIMSEETLVINGVLTIRKTLFARTIFLLGDISVVFALVFLARHIASMSKSYRRQAVIILIALVVPILPDLLWDYINQFFEYTTLYIFSFAVMGVILFIGILRYELFSITPIVNETILRSVKIGYLVLDKVGGIIDYNIEANRILGDLGFKLENGGSGYNIISKWNNWYNACSELSEGKLLINLKQFNKQYSVHIYPLYYANNKVIGTVSIFYDITERIRTEKEIQKKSKVLAETNEFKDKLISVIAHDIRNPIAMLLNLVEFIEEDMSVMTEENKEVVAEIIELVRKIFAMVENLLNWVESQKKGIGCSPENYKLILSVKRVVGIVKHKANIKNIKINIRIDESIIVYADKEMIEIVLRNLITNSVKFTDSEGEINIEAKVKGEDVLVSVKDNGIGIDKSIIERLKSGKDIMSLDGTSGEKGSGLGLILCKEFIEKNNGKLSIESRLNEGTTVCFSIPNGS